MSKIQERLEILSMWVVKIVGAGIFLYLSYYAMRYTHYMVPRTLEKTDTMKDNFFLNMLYLVLFIAVLYVLHKCEKKMGTKTKNILSWMVVLLTIAWIGLTSLWWITSVDRNPESDQLFVWAAASYFAEGTYPFLQPDGGYFSVYPHQLPLVALMEGFFRIVGPFNYFAYQVLNIIFTSGTIMLGYLLVREKSKSLVAALCYAFFVSSCLPLIFYSSWVYGELACLFFTFLAAWTLCVYVRKKKMVWLIGTVFGLAMATANRKNAIILVVAFCILGIVYAICKKEKKMLIAVGLSIICPILIYGGVYKMYEVRSGYEHGKGMPATLFVEMGLHESLGRYGWYDESSMNLLKSVNYDVEQADAIARERIAQDMEGFLSDPQYAALFFREKILSQWNNPLFQSLFFTANYTEKNMPGEGTFVYKISNDYFFNILSYSDVLHLIVFVGTLFYFVLGINKENNILQYLFAVALIGGFLFSIMWEAKGRYMFPYYITMLPLAVIGYTALIARIEIVCHRIDKRKGKR